MAVLPSVWGKHEVARFEPVLVRNTLVTVVLDQPEEWSERLTLLGFRETQNGWARIGAVAQAEYEYLSSDIDLIGMRDEYVLEVEGADIDGRPPQDLQDMILYVWQKKYEALHSCFLIELGENPSRGKIWSAVESALAGESSPESDLVVGLAIEKLRSTTGLSVPVEQYGIRIGAIEADSPPTPSISPSQLLQAAGESIEWLSEDGIHHAGRLANDLRVDDVGCWVYTSSPAWAGGYPVVNPEWLARHQVYYNVPTNDWLPIDLELNQRSSHVNQDDAASLVTAPISIEGPKEWFRHLEILANFASSDFAVAWNNGDHDYFNRLQSSSEIEPEEFKRLFDWIQSITDGLTRLSDQAFGKDGIRFKLTGQRFEASDDSLPLRWFVSAGINLSMSAPTFHEVEAIGVLAETDTDTPVSAQENRTLDLERACQDALVKLSDRAKLIQKTGLEVGRFLDIEETLIPAHEFGGSRPQFWERYAALLEGQVTQDQILSALSVCMRGTGNVVNRLQGRRFDSFAASSFVIADQGVSGTVEVSLNEISNSAVSLKDVSNHINAGGSVTGNWISEVSCYQVEAFEVSVSWPQGIARPKHSSLSYRRDPNRDSSHSRVLIKSREEASEVIESLLAEIEPLLAVADTKRVETLRKAVKGMDLLDRVNGVADLLRSMPHEELRQRVATEMMRKSSTFADATSERQQRISEKVTLALKTDNVQGMAVAISNRWADWKSILITPEVTVQSRAACLGKALSEWKERHRRRAQYIYLDAITFADPALASLLNGDGPAILKTSADQSADGYQDTGVVAGLAAKDIRGLGRDKLLADAHKMNDQQKAKYLTRELIWPRRSMDELREQGVDLKTAFTYDMMWKAVPKLPKSISWDHVQAFVHLVTSMKEGLEPLLKKPYVDTTVAKGFASSAVAFMRDLFDDPLLQANYDRRSLRFSKYHIYLHRFDLTTDYRYGNDLNKLDWSMIAKKSAKPKIAKTGSRVQRNAVERIGPDFRMGRSVTGEDFIKTFGFSGVEYGNWTNQSEREKHLNFAYDSMMDFSRLLDVEPMVLSLGGKLGLCIGSRGRGGARSANAHFEPVNMAINLTRMRGDGTLAHEYCHAIAEHYGRIATGTSEDVTDTLAYSMIKAGAVPKMQGGTGLREPVALAFHNLMVSIMRKPDGDGDSTDIGCYTKLSDMLVSSKEMDGSKKPYWSTPHEMFARAMEVWFKDQLTLNGERNDYLVGSGLGANGSVYPNTEHLKRIDQYASQWIEALSTEQSKVMHPFLGQLQMPVLNSQIISKQPLTQDDLAMLAKTELERLFGDARPELRTFHDPQQRAGFYSVASNLISLNAASADRSTFYHEAWHAASHTLLTRTEKQALAKVFAPGGAMAKEVAKALCDAGHTNVIETMLDDTEEVQAYAFQLWEEGKFHFGEPCVSEKNFKRVDSFIAGVENVSDLLGGAEVARKLFMKFMSGEMSNMASRKDISANVNQVDVSLTDPDWDDNSLLVWDVESVVQEHSRTFQSMR